jgi:hypothetical protein
VAWIGAGGSVRSGHASDTEVGRVDRRGFALLDAGGGIDTRSLRLHRSTVSWLSGGRRRSASLL